MRLYPVSAEPGNGQLRLQHLTVDVADDHFARSCWTASHNV